MWDKTHFPHLVMSIYFRKLLELELELELELASGCNGGAE